MDKPVSSEQNTAASPPQNDHIQPNGRAQTMDQAEEMADRLIERVSGYASWISTAVLRLAARAREEAADMWAEAEHISRRKKG